MKKLIILLFSVVLFASCTTENKPEVSYKEPVSKVQIIVMKGDLSFKEVDSLMRAYPSIHEGKFTSEKHRYKIFIAGQGRSRVMSASHDPDCPYCFILFD